MKILIISHMYPSSQSQAYGIFIHKQVKALVEQGCEVKVISPVPYAPWPLTILKKKWQSYASVPAKDKIEGIEVHYPRYLEFPRSFLLEQAGFMMYLGMRGLLKRLSKEFHFDLIHAHVALPDGHAASFFQREYQVPVVITVHGQDFQSTLHRGEKAKARLAEVLGAADKVITVSSKLKRMVQDEPFAPKIEVINNGIDLEDCQGTGGMKPSSGNIKLISVSNLKKTKGLDLTLQALPSLLPKYPALTYYIVGEGEERQNLENLVDALKLRNHVVFLGRLTHPEAMKEMAAADIFCLPSWQEGFGVVYIEAMAQGVPVIGVQGEGIEDVIIHGHNGLLVRPQNVGDIAEALDSLLSDASYARRLAEAGRDTVAGGFTWSENAGKTRQIYQRLLT